MSSGLCEVCGMGVMTPGASSLYCSNCGAESALFVEEAFDGDDTHMYNPVFRRQRLRGGEDNAGLPPRDGEGLTPFDSQNLHLDQTWSAPMDMAPIDASLPGSQFVRGSTQTAPSIPNHLLASSIRSSYVGGLQRILQLQCEVLVKQFGVTPLICGLVGPLWLKYVASTRIFGASWAEEAIEVAEHRERWRKGNRRRVFQESTPMEDAGEVATAEEEMRGKKRRKKKPRVRKGAPEPRTSYGRKSRFVWLNALKERIPLSVSLALCYLSCFIAREPVLPTDITEWASEGRLPYLAAFLEVSKLPSYRAPNTVGGNQGFPISPQLMFRPATMMGSRTLEHLAGFIAERIAIQLPPVNFHTISSGLLRNTGLPVDPLSAYICRLYAWYHPPGLWLSGKDNALPNRVHVMAMLIIALKVLYKLDGRPSCQGQEGDTSASPKGLSRKEFAETGCSRAVHAIVASAKIAGPKRFLAKQEEVNFLRAFGKEVPAEFAAKNYFNYASELQIRGRKRVSVSTSDQTGENSNNSRDQQDGGSSSRPGTEAKLGGKGKMYSHAKDVVDILDSMKTTDLTSDDKRLQEYLQYCQTVIYPGYDRDAGVQTTLDCCWEIYDKYMKEGRKPAGRGAAHSVGTDGVEVELPSSDQDICKQSRLQEGEHSNSSWTAGSHARGGASAKRLRANGRSIHVAMKEQKEAGEKKSPLHRQNSGDVRTEEAFVSVPARVVDRGSRKESMGLARVIADMKNAGFSYLPPLSKSVAPDLYVRYEFHASAGDLTAVHSDYFKVLRACGSLIKVHPRALHRCVQFIEKGLSQVEGNVEAFLGDQTGVVADLAEAVKRRKRFRIRDKELGRRNSKLAAEKTHHTEDLSYL